MNSIHLLPAEGTRITGPGSEPRNGRHGYDLSEAAGTQTSKTVKVPIHRRHRQRQRRNIPANPAQLNRRGYRRLGSARRRNGNRHHPQHRSPDRQLRERAARARRQHTVHLRRRLQQRHRNQLRDAARPLVHGHQRRGDARPPQQRAERQLGDHRQRRGATRRPRSRYPATAIAERRPPSAPRRTTRYN